VVVLELEWQARGVWDPMAMECFWISVLPQCPELMDILVVAALRLVLAHQDDVFSKVVLPQIQQDLVTFSLGSEGETVVDLQEQGQLQG
jgi:hypothetical protein